MEQGSRPKIVVGNWKMHKTIAESLEFVESLASMLQEGHGEICLAVPFISIPAVAKAASRHGFLIGAQNMHDSEAGAFTGEISAEMLVDAGARHVLLGHSERRLLFSETDDFIQRKVVRALRSGLRPILCIGETEQQRREEQTKKVLSAQLNNCLAGLSPEDVSRTVIAYEPVWAIGTGLAATPEQAEEVHRFCRQVLAQTWNEQVAQTIPILYGGSVRPDNIDAIMEMPNIDGVLVGGASLKPDSFSKIVNCLTMNVT